MLNIDSFLRRLGKPNHPGWLLVAVDCRNTKQLYLLTNGGLGNINCAPIDQYPAEIKACAQKMICDGVLYMKPNEYPLNIGAGKSVMAYFYQPNETLLEDKPKLYFSSIFIGWQHTHQVTDKKAAVLLSLSEQDFAKFREDKLEITQALLEKLHETTGLTKQVWLKLFTKHQSRRQT